MRVVEERFKKVLLIELTEEEYQQVLECLSPKVTPLHLSESKAKPKGQDLAGSPIIGDQDELPF